MDQERIEALKQEIEDKKQEIEDLEDFEITDEEYMDILDDIYGDCEIAGTKRSTGYTLKEVDPIMFDMGKGEEEYRIRTEKEEELKEELEELESELKELEEELKERLL